MLALLATQLFSLSGREARAAELETTLRGQAEYQTNAFGRKPEEDAASLRVSPQLRLVDREGNVQYRIGTVGSYTVFLDESGSGGGLADFYSTQGDADIQWVIGPRTSLTVQDSFQRRTQSAYVLQGFDGIEAGANDFDLAIQRVTRNQLEWGFNHLFTQRLRGSLSGSHFLVLPDDRDRIDEQTMGAQASLSYALTERLSLGFGGGYTHQSFESDSQLNPELVADGVSVTINGTPALLAAPGETRPVRVGAFLTQRSRIVQAFATASYRFDRTLTLNLQGGPAFVRGVTRTEVGQDLDGGFGPRTPGVFVQSNTSGSTTFFADVRIIKRMQRWRARLSYTRRQSEGSGDGQSTGIDRVRAALTYDANLWDATVDFGYSLRTNLTDQQPIDRDGDGTLDGAEGNRSRNTINAGASLSYRISNRISWNLGMDYRFQERRRTGDIDNWRVFSGFSLRLDPLHLELP